MKTNRLKKMPINANTIIVTGKNISINDSIQNDGKSFSELRQMAETLSDINKRKQIKIENSINSKKTSRYLEDLIKKGD
jgi:hypothetical protein